MQDFHTQLEQYINQNNVTAANVLIMRELGRIIVSNKQDFIALLNECGIDANENMSDDQLVELYVNKLLNQKLLLGTAFLVNMHNKRSNADGESEVSDEAVKSAYAALSSNFIGENDLSDEDYENAIGDAWAGAIQGVSGLGTKIVEGRQKKKYGAQDLLAKKIEAKTELTKAVIEQKQAKAKAEESKKKTQRTLLIIGGVVVGLSALAAVWYYVKKK